MPCPPLKTRRLSFTPKAVDNFFLSTSRAIADADDGHELKEAASLQVSAPPENLVLVGLEKVVGGSTGT